MSQLLRPRVWWLFSVLVVLAMAGCNVPSVLPPAPEAPAAGETLTLYVGPAQVDCVGVAPQKCLLVRENPDAPYQFFYDTIAGFNYEEGFNYELSVSRSRVENAPADASVFKYALLQEVSKEPAGEVSTLYVAPMSTECETTQIYECLLVAESADGEYRPFYGEIRGFEFEEGYQYALLVEKVAMDQPPESAPAGVWNLLATTSKTAAPVAVTTGSSLEGTLWVLDSYVNAQGETVPVVEGTEVTATFQDGRLSGNASCNNYGADYTVTGDGLTIGVAVTTLMMCDPEEASLQEQAYLAALAQVATYQIEGESLTLANADGDVILTFTAGQPTALTGTTWVVTGHNNGKGGVVSTLSDTELTLVLGEDGTASGSSGCNNFTGGYTLDGDAIVLGPLASTMMMCVEPEGIMEQEAQYLAALQSAATVTVQGDKLELRTADGALAVSALAQSSATPEPAAGGGLEGVLWLLTSYVNDKGETLPPVAGTEVTATFQDGSLSGNAGCNNYAAEYTVDGNNLTIGMAVTTLMMCNPEEVALQEQAYLAALAQVAAYQIEGESLVLADGNGQAVLTYTVSKPAPLAETNWQVGFYNNGKEALVSPIAGSQITLFFSADGQASGTTGCNNFTGGYTVDADAIQLGPLATTRKLCAEPEGIMDQETSFLAALQSAATFNIRGNDLELLNAEGVRAVTASAQPLVAAAGGSPADVIGKTWVWQGTFYSNDTELQPDEPGAYTLELLDDGQALARADCNSVAGQYTLAEDGTISLQLPTDTLSDCGEASPADEFLNDLNTAAVFSLADDALVIDLEAEAGSVQFAQAGAVPVAPPTMLEPMPALTEVLVGQVWAWQSLESSDGSVTTVEQPDKYTIEFLADGTLNIQADCNTGFGSYTGDNGSLTIEVAVTTRMACPPGTMDTEFVSGLNEVAGYVIDGGQLYLNLKADAGSLILAPLAVGPAERAPETELVGQVWAWQSFQGNDDSVVTVETPDRYTLEFLADGTYHIRADCNTGSGGYTVDGSSLQLGPAAMTLMACLPGSMDSEFTQYLGDVVSYVIQDSMLYLNLKMDAGNVVMAPLSAVPAPAATPAPALPSAASPLVGPTWQWTGFQSPTDRFAVDSPQLYTATFGADGSVSVVADCNTGGGTYTAERARLTINITRLTMAACPVGSLSDAFVSNLNQAAIYFVAGDSLYVVLEADNGTMKLRAAR